MTNSQVAETIMLQLGGAGKVARMIGAGPFVYDDTSVSFLFKARAKNLINGIRVRLDPSDTYTVEFLRCTVKGRKVVDSFSDIYAENLKRTVELRTGLYLSFN